jgi:hypothetical protein
MLEGRLTHSGGVGLFYRVTFIEGKINRGIIIQINNQTFSLGLLLFLFQYDKTVKVYH